MHECPIDRRVELPIESIERRSVSEGGSFEAAFKKAISAPIEFIVYEQSEKVQWSQTLGSCLLNTNVEGVGNSTEPKLA